MWMHRFAGSTPHLIRPTGYVMRRCLNRLNSSFDMSINYLLEQKRFHTDLLNRIQRKLNKSFIYWLIHFKSTSKMEFYLLKSKAN